LPENEDLRRQIFLEFHSSALGGHLGKKKVLELM
jgi:hypothetical protein